MSKRLISGLILLMSISLVGIIAVQILWIRNAILIEEKTFESNINKALHKVVVKLETQEGVLLLSEGLHAIPNVKVGGIEVCEIRKFIDQKNNNTQGHVQIKTTQKLNGKVIGKAKANTQILVSGLSDNVISYWHSAKSLTDSLIDIDIHINAKDTLLRTIRKEKQIENIFEKVVVEFKTKDLAIKDRINLEKLPQLIQSELKNHNINSDFKYAIITNSPKKIVHSSDSSVNYILKNSNYQVNLFPNDILSSENQVLSLTFPNRFNLVYQSILPLLILSVVFTLFIIITFVNAVYFILKQKKISNIKSDFINNITHEFKTPIATIGLASDSINNPKVIGNPDMIRYFTGIIKDENLRMNKQVENILQLSLFGKHELKLNPQACHLNDIIKKAVEHIQLQIDEKNGILTCNLSALNDIVKIDEVHFLNVLFNLFDNAIKYSNNNPAIEIETSNIENEIQVTITDRGIGMNPGTVKKIFKKFYRAETGNIHNVKGFGLGLSYVKLVIEKLNGTVKVESKIAHGTRIIINLPLNNL